MDDLSLKPKQPEKEKKSFFEDKRKERKGAFYILIGIVLVCLLHFIFMNLYRMRDDKIKETVAEMYKDSVRTVIKIDTVYVPGKVVESNFEACYDVSDANHILITVKNGVVEVSNND